MTMVRNIASFLPLMTMGMFSQDFVEYGAYHTGKRTEGVAFSVQTFATKFTEAIGAVLGGFLLESVYGYVPNAEQSASTIQGLFQMYTLYPIIGLAAAVIIMVFFYKLKESDVQDMINEMEEREAKV